jgi:peptide deformylase
VLRRKAKRVSVIGDWVGKLIDDMTETMQAANGMGLAAPQVGVSMKVIIVQVPGDELICLVNPEIVKKSGERVVTEGCLSVPGFQGEIKRSVSVTVKGRDRTGKEVRLKAEDYLGQALEHEIDHLNGVLYTDHLESPDKLYRIETQAQSVEGEG